MARALSEGTDKHAAEEFAAELERCGATLDAHADHPGVRVSLEVPVSRLPKALGLLADALRAPAFAGQRGRAAGAQPARRDPARAGQPGPPRRQGSSPRSCSRPPPRMSRPAPGHRGDGRPDRLRGRPRLLRRPCTARHGHRRDRRRPHRRRPRTRVLADTLGAWTRLHRRAAGPCRRSPPTTPAAWSSWTAPAPSRRSCSSAASAPTGTTASGPPRCSARTASAAPSPPVWTACCARRRATPTACGPSARCCAPAARTARAPRCSPSAARWTPPNTGPALDDLWKVLRTLAAEGLTDAERDVAVQNLVGVAPLKYETAAAVAGTLADQVEQHLPGRLPGAVVRAARRDRHGGGHRGGRQRLPRGPAGDGPRGRRGADRGARQGARASAK